MKQARIDTRLLPPIIERVWLDERQIRRKVRQIARRIERDYEGLVPHLVTVMKGGLFFLTDLARALRIPHTLDFLAITSYGPDTHTARCASPKTSTSPLQGAM
jgi:hypoxanthine phosphoribosyltransferase